MKKKGSWFVVYLNYVVGKANAKNSIWIIIWHHNCDFKIKECKPLASVKRHTKRVSPSIASLWFAISNDQQINYLFQLTIILTGASCSNETEHAHITIYYYYIYLQYTIYIYIYKYKYIYIYIFIIIIYIYYYYRYSGYYFCITTCRGVARIYIWGGQNCGEFFFGGANGNFGGANAPLL